VVVAASGPRANLFRRQAATAAWAGHHGTTQSTHFSTAWDVLILPKGVATIPPTALICDCATTYDQTGTDGLGLVLVASDFTAPS